MPQRRTAIKDLRKNHRRNLHNLDIKTEVKKTTKKFLSLVKGKQKAEANKFLVTVYKTFDKAAKRKILHKNTAARRKSHYANLLASLA